MGWYLEHAQDVMLRKGNLFPREVVMSQTGFRSVFAFAEADAKQIIQQGSSKNFSRFAVFTDELLLDFDNGRDEQFNRAEKWARDSDCTFSVFESGSKGLHLEIAAVPKYGRTVPMSQQAFVETIMGVTSDVSLYRHGSLYRLPGTLHKKTGKPKKRVASNLGDALVDYTLLDESCIIDFGSDSVHDKVVASLERVLRWHSRPPNQGRRYQTLWSVAQLCKEGGLSQSTVTELLQIVNESWGPLAKEEKEVTRAIHEVF